MEGEERDKNLYPPLTGASGVGVSFCTLLDLSPLGDGFRVVTVQLGVSSYFRRPGSGPSGESSRRFRKEVTPPVMEEILRVTDFLLLEFLHESTQGVTGWGGVGVGGREQGRTS